MILSSSVESAIFLVCFVMVVAAALHGRRTFLFAVGFMLPLMVPRLTLAVGIDWYKILGPLAIGLALVLRPRGTLVAMRAAAGLKWFLGYALIVTLMWMWAEYGWLQRYRFAMAMGLSGAQAEYKMPVQLASFLAQVSIVFVAPLWARTRREAWGAVWGLTWGCGVSCVAGISAMLLLGAGTLNAGAASGTFQVEGAQVIRLGGLSGEPKFLAAHLGVILFFLAAHWAFGPARLRKRMRWLSLGTLLMLLLTYSASAYGGVAIGLGVFFFFLFRHLRGTQVVGVVLLGMVLTLGISSTALLSSAVQQGVYNKVFGEDANLDELKDVYVLDAYRDHPQYIPFGYGLGGGDLAVMPYVGYVHLKYNRTPTPSFTGFRLLGDVGLIGLALLGWQVRLWGRRLRIGDTALHVFVVCGFVAMLFTSQAGLGGYMYLAGAVLVMAACPETAAAVPRRSARRAPGLGRRAPPP